MSEPTHMSQAELLALLRERFGDDPMKWAFVCPSCKDVATGQDFRDALAAIGASETASAFLGQQCIGRVLGALQEKKQTDWTGRGCDWAAFGLFRGPWFIHDPEGREIPSFRIAEKEPQTA